MKQPLLFLLMLAFTTARAQADKGMSLKATTSATDTGKIYALIVGVSRYEDPVIPQLQFADRDAIAFKNYLLASGVDPENITLLLNEQATHSKFILALDEICTQKTKAGDKVFIYFSGHGDVESRVVTNAGYLLSYDAPHLIYSISAIDLRKLQDYIATLSANGVLPIVITDACHSGKLAGGTQGMKNIQIILGEKWKDEVKILSCQPGEVSLEGREWGGGRGLFSYELINGLTGLADKNNDGKIVLRELSMYLMEKVPDAAFMNQNPLVSGDMNTAIALVNQRTLARFNWLQNGTSSSTRDTENDYYSLLDGEDKISIKSYYNFTDYLEKKKLISDSTEVSAHYYLNQIPDNDATRLLRIRMKRNLAAALQSETEELIKFIYSNDYNKVETNWRNEDAKIYRASKKMKVAIDLLSGSSQLMSGNLLAKQLFLSAFANFKLKKSAGLPETKSMIDSCLSLDSALSYGYWLKGVICRNMGDFEAYIEATEKAVELSPTWTLPILDLASAYLTQKNYDKSKEYCLRAIDIDSTEGRSYGLIGWGCWENKDTACAINFFKQGVLANSNDARGYVNLGLTYLNIGDFENSILNFDKAIELDTKYATPLYCKAYWFAYKGDKSETLVWLAKALAMGKDEGFNPLKDAAMDGLRDFPEFKALMKTYFPDKYKD